MDLIKNINENICFRVYMFAPLKHMKKPYNIISTAVITSLVVLIFLKMSIQIPNDWVELGIDLLLLIILLAFAERIIIFVFISPFILHQKIKNFLAPKKINSLS